MIEFGRTLREAREAKGYSISELAEKTRIMHQIVEDLENENFSRIAAPIYGRGFVKLYCEAVGIEAKPLVDEYMAIQTGARAATIHVRAAAQPPKPAATKPADENNAAPAAAAAATSTRPAKTEPLPAPAPAKAPVSTPMDTVIKPAPAAAKTNDLFDAPLPPAKEKPHSRNAPLPPRLPPNIPRPPSNLWRIAVVVAGMLLVLWGMVAGLRALYRATMTPPPQPTVSTAESDAKQTAAPAPAAAEVKPDKPLKQDAAAGSANAEKTARTPMRIPPLYID